MQLTNNQYAQVVNARSEPEVIGFDFTDLISPLVDLTSSVISNWGGSKKPPPPPKVPWVAIGIGGGLMVTMMMVMVMKK